MFAIIILGIVIVFLCSEVSIHNRGTAVASVSTSKSISADDLAAINKCAQLMTQMDKSYIKLATHSNFQEKIRHENGKLYYHQDARREITILFIQKPSGLWKMAWFGIMTGDQKVTDKDYEVSAKIILEAMNDMQTDKIYAVRPKTMDASTINTFHDGVKAYAWEKYCGKFKVKSTGNDWEVWELYKRL